MHPASSGGVRHRARSSASRSRPASDAALARWIIVMHGASRCGAAAPGGPRLATTAADRHPSTRRGRTAGRQVAARCAPGTAAYEEGASGASSPAGDAPPDGVAAGGGAPTTSAPAVDNLGQWEREIEDTLKLVSLLSPTGACAGPPCA
jgi:hypothetical protein